MRKLLWVGDAVCDSGFARATHYTLDVLRRSWDVVVLGLNYRGDPHDYPYKIYPAMPASTVGSRDIFGVNRIAPLVQMEKPDLVVIQNDPWNIPRYVQQLETLAAPPKMVGAIAVDGKNCRGKHLNGLDHVIFWTEFAKGEALAGGMNRPASVVPLGVDLDIYSPGDKLEARKALGIPDFLHDQFMVLNVNRNQPRKRLDLTMKYFAAWVHGCNVNDAFLYLHVCPTGDVGYDCDQLTGYYGLRKRVCLAEPGVFHASTEAEVRNTYRSADVQVNTGQGEGWGLTTLEGMACGIPQIVGDWAALGEWAAPAAVTVKCSATSVTPNRINVVGGIPDEEGFVQALNEVYTNRQTRDRLQRAGLLLANEERYRWEHIGTEFGRVLDGV